MGRWPRLPAGVWTGLKIPQNFLKILRAHTPTTIKASWACIAWEHSDGIQNNLLLDGMQELCYNTCMDRKEKISRSLNKINEKFHLLFDWLTCEDLGRDWDGVGDPYSQKNNKIVGQDTESDTKKL